MAKLTKDQIRKFKKLSKEMNALFAEIKREIPGAMIFIEDGNASIYDWPDDIDNRPIESLATEFWPFASGGGR